MKWNSHAGPAIGTKEEIKSLNAFLDNLKAKTYEGHQYLYENEKEITAETIKNRMLGKSEKARMLIEIFKEHNRKVKSLVGKEFAPLTYKRYQSSLQHTRSFLSYKYGVVDIDVRKVDPEFIAEYDFYLRGIRKCNNNSTLKYIKNFGKIIRICLTNGWIIKNFFVNYKGKIKTVNRVYLTEEEIQKMADKCFDIDRLSQVRDVFLFCCFTGLAYIDIKKLKISEITKGVDGGLWIFTNRQKTDTRSAIPLLPIATQLIKKYSNHHYRIDLVFYHRILKTHVLLDLKIGEFNHSDSGQMNVYLNYYKDNEFTNGDNDPIRIILCSGKNEALAKYATMGLPQQVFVSKYLVNLPGEKELQKIIEEEKEKIK